MHKMLFCEFGVHFWEIIGMFPMCSRLSRWFVVLRDCLGEVFKTLQDNNHWALKCHTSFDTLSRWLDPLWRSPESTGSSQSFSLVLTSHRSAHPHRSHNTSLGSTCMHNNNKYMIKIPKIVTSILPLSTIAHETRTCWHRQLFQIWFVNTECIKKFRKNMNK